MVPLTTRVRKCVPTTVINCNNARNCIIISVDDRHYFPDKGESDYLEESNNTNGLLSCSPLIYISAKSTAIDLIYIYVYYI